MEKAILPIGQAQEPNEGARNPLVESMSPHQDRPISSRKLITIAENTNLSEKSASQRSYKDVLSQPPEELSHRQKLLWLQKRRGTGLWVQCDECDRWRFLPHVLDSTELPHRWYCRMNPDRSFAACSVPETQIRPHEEEDLIHSVYSAGSLVWARLAGWPWWPAMVDDCPDTEQYYWLDGFCDIPTHYNVTFFDTNEVTRAWIAPNNLKPFLHNRDTAQFSTKIQKKYKSRIDSAKKQAEKASKLPWLERLEKYSFLAKYTGSVNPPKPIPKKELMRQHKKLQRRFNFDFGIPEVYESDDDSEPLQVKASHKNRNMILLGTPKRDKSSRHNVDSAAKNQDTVGNDNNAEKAATPALVPFSTNRDNELKNNAEANATMKDLDETVATSVQDKNIADTAGTPALPANRDKPKRRIQDSLNMIHFRETVTPQETKIVPETVTPQETEIVPTKKAQPMVPKFAAKKEKAKKRVKNDTVNNTAPPRKTLRKENSEPSANENKLEPDSMAVQIGSTNDTVPATVTESFDDDTSKTYVPESGKSLDSTQSTVNEKNFELRAGSPCSDDFDF